MREQGGYRHPTIPLIAREQKLYVIVMHTAYSIFEVSVVLQQSVC